MQTDRQTAGIPGTSRFYLRICGRKCSRNNTVFKDGINYCRGACYSETKCGTMTIPSSHLQVSIVFDSRLIGRVCARCSSPPSLSLSRYLSLSSSLPPSPFTRSLSLSLSLSVSLSLSLSLSLSNRLLVC